MGVVITSPACSMQRVIGTFAESGDEGEVQRPISIPKDKASVCGV